jgi:arylsulfatase A-like enzyme
LKLSPNVPAGKASEYAAVNLGKYYGLIESLDDEFGRLTAKLDALGLAENTIVVYTSDHGDMLGSHGLMFKRWPHDESSRVPFLIRWPKHIPEKSTIAMPFGTQDIFPTLANLAGIGVPSGIHGNDYSAVLLGQSKAKRQEHLFMTMQHGYVPWPGWRGVRTEQYLYARTEAESWFLYDIKNDPYQQHNLLKDKPATAKEMDALTLDTMKKLGETWRGGPRNVGDADDFAASSEKAKSQNLGGEWPKK